LALCNFGRKCLIRLLKMSRVFRLSPEDRMHIRE
jgi:hypothetical protein